MTGFANKLRILSSFLTDYGTDPEFEEFVQFNDSGLPLAYLSEMGLCELTTSGEVAIEETWTLLLNTLGIIDSDFNNLDELFSASSQGQ